MKLAVILLLLIVGTLSEQYKVTPVGYVPESCIHEVPNGAHIEDKEGGAFVTHPNGKVQALPECKISWMNDKRRLKEYDGWLAYTTFQYTAGPTLDAFFGYFTVPDNPQNYPEVLYIFTALQNVDWIPIIDPEVPVFDIIQPVLQYPANTGSDWSIRSWYVTLHSGVVVSREVYTKTGDNIYGNMTRTGNPTEWYIGGTSSVSGLTTHITIARDRLLNQPWAYNTAECYGCGGGCGTEPTMPVHFTKLALFAGKNKVTPIWVPHTSPTPICHESAQINGPDSVTISFQ